MPEKYDNETLKKLQSLELEMLEDFLSLCEKYRLRCFGIGGTGIGALRHGGFIPWDDDIDLAFPREDYEQFCRLVQEEMGDKYAILSAETVENYPLFTARMMRRGTTFREYSMKDVDCEFGIFLDLYAYDNVPDNDFLMKFQAIEVWIISKLLILCSIPRPHLFYTGAKAKLIYAACGIAHRLLCALHISKRGLYLAGKRACTRYNGVRTKRLAYLPEARPFTSMIKRSDLYPLKKLPFEHLKLYFPHDMHEMLYAYYGDYMQLPPEEKRYNHCPYQLDFGDVTVRGYEHEKEETPHEDR